MMSTGSLFLFRPRCGAINRPCSTCARTHRVVHHWQSDMSTFLPLEVPCITTRQHDYWLASGCTYRCSAIQTLGWRRNSGQELFQTVHSSERLLAILQVADRPFHTLASGRCVYNEAGSDQSDFDRWQWASASLGHVIAANKLELEAILERANDMDILPSFARSVTTFGNEDGPMCFEHCTFPHEQANGVILRGFSRNFGGGGGHQSQHHYLVAALVYCCLW